MLYLNGESELRIAMRHVQQGRDCVRRQLDLIAKLRERGLPTGQAEEIFIWLDETQRAFEVDYLSVKRKVLARLEELEERQQRVAKLK